MPTLLHRTFLIVAALMGISAFFLPYLSLDFGLGQFSVGGMNYIQLIIDAYTDTQASETSSPLANKIYEGIYQIAIKPWLHESSTGQKLSAVGLVFVLLGPFYFLLFSLGYLYRGIMGKRYKRGIIFNLLFLLFSWAIFYFIGKENKMFDINFFWYADFGYWIAFVAMFVAAFSDFFWKETTN